MSESQKKSIYDIIPKTFTINSESISASCMYENQMIPGGRDSEPFYSNTTYPLITLKYDDTNEFIMDMGEVKLKTARLNINVFAIPIDNRASGGAYVNGKVVLDSMVSEILDTIDASIDDLISYGVLINDRVRGTKVADLSTIATRKHVYRNKFTLDITYEV